MKQIRFTVLFFALWLPGCTLIADTYVDRVQKLYHNGDEPLSREKASTHRVASPLNHARKDAPPFLLLHAEQDTLDRRQQNQAIFATLKKAGHPDVTIHELKDRSHNSTLPNIVDQKDTGAGHILKFIRHLCVAQDNGSEVNQRPWSRHTIDSADKATGKLGADGVRLADFNGDGVIDGTDLSVLLGNWSS